MKYNKEIFIEKANIKHNEKYDYSLVDYINSKTNVKILCLKHGIFEQNPSMHLLRNGCRLCGVERRNNLKIKSKLWFIDKANKIHQNKYDYSFIEYVNTQVKIKINCKIHGIFEQQPNAHLNGKGCPICGINQRNIKNSSNNDDFIRKANIIHNNKYDYAKVIYVSNKNKVIIVCPLHGEFKQTPNAHISGNQGCPMCAESKGEIKIREILIENNINFISQKKFTECKNSNFLFFDFYLPDNNMLIDYDGIQHFKSIDFFGGIDGLIKQQKCDEIKNDFAKKNNIRLIRIKYVNLQKIKNILIDEKII